MSEIPFVNQLGDSIQTAITASSDKPARVWLRRPKRVVIILAALLTLSGGVALAGGRREVGAVGADQALHELVAFVAERVAGEPRMAGSVMLILFVRTLESFETPALIGIPARIYVYTSEIYLAFNEYPPDYGRGVPAKP